MASRGPSTRPRHWKVFVGTLLLLLFGAFPSIGVSTTQYSVGDRNVYVPGMSCSVADYAGLPFLDEVGYDDPPARCLSVVLGILKTPILPVLDGCRAIQVEWLQGKLSRYQIVDEFLHRLLPADDDVFAPLMSRINIISTSLENGGEILQPTNRSELVTALKRTTWIPFLTGKGWLKDDVNSERYLDGYFSLPLHPPCRYTAKVPFSWESYLHSLNPGARTVQTPWRMDREEGGDKGDPSIPSISDTFRRGVGAASLPHWMGICGKVSLGITVGLYVLNQKHLLPKPLSRIVSKALFWPTLPITVAKRMGSWTTIVDDTVIIGGAPFGFVGIPEQLYDYGVSEQYQGPVKSYRKLGISQLYLPTVDHFEPSVKDLAATVRFIQRHKKQGSRVYVHCRAGHGRSAAGVFAWMLSQDPDADPQTLNEYFCNLRNVRKTLWKQSNVRRFHANLKEIEDDDNGEEEKEHCNTGDK
eukprot:scaffold2661_cov166-Amphora_coffeaeformis.AAC.1